MRKWFASLGVLGLAATAATAQTIPTVTSQFLYQIVEDDNGAETSYKLSYPSKATEDFNVDFNADGAGMTCLGLALRLYVSGGTAQFSKLAICGDNLALDASGRTPDYASPLSSLTNPTGGPGAGAGYCPGFTTYDLPDVTIGTGGVHGVVEMPSGDSATWLCTDLFDSSGFPHTGTRHSFWTTDNYATPASYFFSKYNWMVRLAGTPPITGGGLFLVNGSLAASIPGASPLSLQFWSADPGAPTLYLEMLKLSPITYIPLPALVLSTGLSNFAPNGIQQLGQLSGPAPCSAVGLSLDFTCFFSDNLDKKKNGKNKIKLANVANGTFTPSKVCSPNLCFGIRDDGVMDSGIFNPRIWFGLGTAAGSNDAASVHMGTASPNAPVVTNLTAIEAITWDFCGTNPCWAAIGIYPANTVLDPTGQSPDLSSPLASVGGTSACYPGGAYTGTWGFPTTTYDTPDILANTTTDYHASATWANAESCIYLGLDNNGSSDDLANDCGQTPSATSASVYSLDGFATVGVPVFANLCMRIDWN